MIDLRVAFGTPLSSITASARLAIAARLDAGEALHKIAQDYGLTDDEVREATVYERAASRR